MLKFRNLLLALFTCLSSIISAQENGARPSKNTYDLIIVSGTPSGIMSAIAAARLGKTSLILERTKHVGGLPANGLGATDLITREATGGLFLEFVTGIKQYYIKKYGEQSEQVKMSKNGYHFEPSVAELILKDMLQHYPQVTVLTNRQFDADASSLTMKDRSISQIKVLNRISKEQEVYDGKFFIDASYEGDLIAAAGVPFALGREGKSEYGELFAGQVYKYWAKDGQEPGSTNMADNAIQAYNYRLSLTMDAANKAGIKKPEHYNREEYVSIIEDVLSGKHAGIEYAEITAQEIQENKRLRAEGKPPLGKNLPEGMQRLVNKVEVPNNKVDANNQHRAFLSTDLPEENWPWPTASWVWRDQFARRLRDYTLGLLYFGQNDLALPEWFRKDCLQWGLAKDEFQDNENFPRQVYVREGRRMKGTYLFKTKDATPVAKGQRPPVNSESITASHYGIDSHAVRKREDGMANLDGFLSYGTAPYTVPFGTLIPPNVANLLAPVPASATHLGLATMRMEPCWMAMGQASGIAAAIAIDRAAPVQKIPVDQVQDKLIDQKSVLIYYRDVKVGDADFKMVQFLGLKGFIPEWEARLNDKISAVDIQNWQKLGNVKLKSARAGITTRLEALKTIYQQFNKS
jgi:hypothetical protein